MARNTLKCIVTGNSRITNNSYLAKKAEKAGTDINSLKEHYVSKTALADLRRQVNESGIDAVAEKLGFLKAKLHNMLVLNGKHSNKETPKLWGEPGKQQTAAQAEQVVASQQ